MNDETLKDKLVAAWIEHKPKVIIGVALIVAFVSGYGTQWVDGAAAPRQLIYTTNKSQTPLIETKPTPEAVPAATKTVAPSSECKIKGNLGSGGKKTFHVPGGSFYDRTNAEICFNTEQEAISAGFIKSSR